VFDVWFWQLIVSPHMAHLAEELARLDCKVTYVAERAMSTERADQGWMPPELSGVRLEYADSDEAVRRLVESASSHSIHICQGIRANRRVSLAQNLLATRGLRQWVIMETVEDSGWRGVIKRFEYSRLFRARRNTLQGLLATGHRMAEWVAARGMLTDKVYPFAYFLSSQSGSVTDGYRKPGPFRFVFVGQLISRKRVDWLVNSLAGLTEHAFELCIVGSGAEEPALRMLAESRLGDRVRWFGTLPLSEVSAVISQTDCLVLPSVHDGWGAVVSEALMVGTPVICSDACGTAGVVQASGFGGVFACDNGDELQVMLEEQLQFGPVNKENRVRLASWAASLGAEEGAKYLMNIINFSVNGGARPLPPWQKR
jgi:glycosyltransferase involved in cell wall biosynthesis